MIKPKLTKVKVYAAMATPECFEKLMHSKGNTKNIFTNIIERSKGYIGVTQMPTYEYIPTFLFTDEESLDEVIEALKGYDLELVKSKNNDILPIEDLPKDIIERLYENQKKDREN